MAKLYDFKTKRLLGENIETIESAENLQFHAHAWFTPPPAPKEWDFPVQGRTEYPIADQKLAKDTALSMEQALKRHQKVVASRKALNEQVKNQYKLKK